MSTNDCFSVSSVLATRLRLTDCFLEVEQTEEGKHSWKLGERDPCMALRRVKELGVCGCWAVGDLLMLYAT